MGAGKRPANEAPLGAQLLESLPIAWPGVGKRTEAVSRYAISNPAGGCPAASPSAWLRARTPSSSRDRAAR